MGKETIFSFYFRVTKFADFSKIGTYLNSPVVI